MSEIKDKIENLYTGAQLLALYITFHGEITAKHPLVTSMIEALYALDGGAEDYGWLANLIERKG